METAVVISSLKKRNTQERIHKIWKLCINLKLFLPVYLFRVSLIFHLLKGACGKEQHGGGADRLCPNGAFFKCVPDSKHQSEPI